MATALAEPLATTAVEPLLAAELDWCDHCGDLVLHGVCRSCESERRRERISETACQRPEAIVARTEDAEMPTGRVATLVVPVTASESAKHVARAAALIATGRLIAGDPLDFALGKLALGRDLVGRTLEEFFGVRLSRNTIAAALQDLHDLGVLPRIGRLGSWVDREAESDWPKKQGA